MIYKFIVLIGFLFTCHTLSAQFLYSKHAQGDMTKKQFIFTGLPGMKKAIIENKKEKYDPDDPANYAFWQEYLEKYWYLTDDYKVLPFDDAYAIAEKDKENTYLVQIARLEGDIYTFMRVMSPTNKVGQTAYSTILNYKVEPADIVYGLMNVQDVLGNKKNYPTKFIPKSAAKTNGKMLKEKTLYIGYYKTKKERAKIEASYPYPYKFVTLEEIDQAILSKEENVLVIRQYKIPSLATLPQSNYVVYSTSDGATVAQSISKTLGKAIKDFENEVK